MVVHVGDPNAGVALVTGVTGIVGRHIVLQLHKMGNWKVYAASRSGKVSYEEHPKGLGDNVVPVRVQDLTRKECVAQDLGRLGEVTHVFHAAFLMNQEDPAQEGETNKVMLANVVEALEESAKAKLKHVYVQTGAKWYGQHLGKYETPATEDTPRALTPNFYYDLEDYLRGRVADGAPWTWSSLRPNPVIGYSPSSFMNLLNAVSAYAAITTKLGLPFRFPGSEAAYNALNEMVNADLLAEAIVFCATHESTANQAFNVSNGDTFRWSQLWPRIAEHFGLVTAPPMKINLAKLMATPEKLEAWKALVQEHGLTSAANDLAKLASWPFFDFVKNLEWDVFQSVQRLRRAGFDGMVLDSVPEFIRMMEHLVDLKVVPPLHVKGGRVEPVTGRVVHERAFMKGT